MATEAETDALAWARMALVSSGYARENELATDAAVWEAVQLYCDGNAGACTSRSHVDSMRRGLAALEEPRCGVEDLPEAKLPLQSTWLRKIPSPRRGRKLTYRFGSTTGDTTGEAAAVRAAMRTWERSVGVRFVPTEDETPHFLISWVKNATIIGDSALARAEFPEQASPGRSRQLIFNDAKRWAVVEDVAGFDVEAVALHEIGHILGVRHIANRSAIMSVSFSKADKSFKEARELTGADIKAFEDYRKRHQWDWLGNRILALRQWWARRRLTKQVT